MVFPHSVLFYHRGSRLSSLGRGSPPPPAKPSEPPLLARERAEGYRPVFFFYSLFTIHYSLSLLMVFPHAIFFSQDPVEDLAGARSRHLFIFDEDNVLRDLETGYLAFAVSLISLLAWPSGLRGGR